MSLTHWGYLLTVLTAVAAGMALSAWTEQQMLIATTITVGLQVAAITCFICGARRRPNLVEHSKAPNPCHHDDPANSAPTSA